MSKAPQPWHAAVLYPVAVATNFFASAILLFILPVITATIGGQILGFGLVPLVAMAAFGYSRADLGLKVPLQGVWLPVAPLGILAWAGAMPLAIWSERVFPLPAEMMEMMEGLLLHPSLPLTLMAAAVGPAIFEEFTFRGFIFGSLRRWSLPGAMVISSALFALTHLMPAYYLFTFALGLLLCILVVRTGSIWPASLVHLTLNTTTILLTRAAATAPEDAPNAAGRFMASMEGVSTPVGIAMLLVSAFAIHQLFGFLPGSRRAPDA